MPSRPPKFPLFGKGLRNHLARAIDLDQTGEGLSFSYPNRLKSTATSQKERGRPMACPLPNNFAVTLLKFGGICLIADETHFGDAGALRHGKHLVHQLVARVCGGANAQFGDRVQHLRLVEI